MGIAATEQKTMETGIDYYRPMVQIRYRDSFLSQANEKGGFETFRSD